MEPSRNAPSPRRWARAAFALDARSLAVYRMALGAILCMDCLLRTRDFHLMFGVEGIFPPEALRRLSADATIWSLAFLIDATWWQGAVLALEGVAGLLLAAGVATRVATVVAWVAVVSVIRRTAPASNAGDSWLACQLFWAMFIPLGTAWSWDAWRRGAAAARPVACCSVATAALVLQLVFVYVSAGLAKCNATWTDGGAIAHALSVHDHGTALGMALARSGLVGGPLTWGVVALEVVAPLLLLAWPTDRVRLVVMGAFAAFHAAIFVLMSVGLFVPISLAAWLPLVPAAAWSRGGGRTDDVVSRGELLGGFAALLRRWRPAALPEPDAG